ncbi:hypothetical protein CFC21_009882 [Triticum aestivum]|uniref:B box-type domain-containing protein n=2 Tax=Triticum aestivum TaxID=4565 RepID=A0A3B5ZPF7_WHEAT|nr:uncharacterized protein LOC123179899 [Triticum aestivum]KAF6992931.1 hypothetical protein CFC21_009882 [Triticum aestivum]
MLRTGVRRPRCAPCVAGADVHCHADAAFLCAPCHAQVHRTSSLASRHRLTRVPPPNHVRAEVSARAMGLHTWGARLRAAGGGRTRVPPPSNIRGRCGAALQLLARRVGLDAGVARLRAAAAFHTLRVEFASTPRMPLRVAMAAALWREVAAHGGVHEPGYALQRLATWAHVPASFIVAVAAAIGRARQVRTAAVDCAIVSPRATPQELCLFV